MNLKCYDPLIRIKNLPLLSIHTSDAHIHRQSNIKYKLVFMYGVQYTKSMSKTQNKTKKKKKSCIKVKVIEDIFYLSLVTIAAVIAASIALKI